MAVRIAIFSAMCIDKASRTRFDIGMTNTASTEAIPEITASATTDRIVDAIMQADRRMLEGVLGYLSGRDREVFAEAWEWKRRLILESDSPDASDGSVTQ
jgi:hypothetical protein